MDELEVINLVFCNLVEERVPLSNCSDCRFFRTSGKNKLHCACPKPVDPTAVTAAATESSAPRKDHKFLFETKMYSHRRLPDGSQYYTSMGAPKLQFDLTVEGLWASQNDQSGKIIRDRLQKNMSKVTKILLGRIFNTVGVKDDL